MTRVSAILATVGNDDRDGPYSDVVYSSIDHELVVRRFKEAVSNYVKENNPSAVAKFYGADELYAEASYDDWNVFASFQIYTFTLSE